MAFNLASRFGSSLRPFVVTVFWAISHIVAANTASIVLVTGVGEKRASETAAWSAAAAKQEVPAGGFVRTLANSQMGLLLIDRTQIRLNQNSTMQIKSAADAKEWTQTNVKLHAGRAWSQARPVKVPGGVADTARLSMETPTATMSIRGTDWEVEILPDGSTQLTVLSGFVDLSNDAGALRVEPGEQAVAVPGKIPVKARLIRPETRIQWVSYWRVQPGRWGGVDRDADLRAAADALAQRGDIAEAAVVLADRLHDGPEPLTIALYARILARLDRLEEAKGVVGGALKLYPQHLELLVAQGELAILDGDLRTARSAFARSLEVDANFGAGWYGLGRIESELGNIHPAREHLDQAIRMDGGLQDARAERAMVESAASNFAEAAAMVRELLATDPENMIALTTLGLNDLKRGQTEQALGAFLQTGTIEPKYARAWLYSAAAFYQLGDRLHALQALREAARLDPRDPLPHLLESLVLSDDLNFGKAIEAAQHAQTRLPYLKSLDQVANDQKGTANLGSALANFGLEEWAAYYATNAATPFWAGSHLFLADRHLGKFNKNSELYLGFLTDPTVFGASNRHSHLFVTPGHYGKIEAVYEKTAWSQTAMIGTANGMVVEPFPVAYFLSGDLSASAARENDSDATGNQFIMGIGARPRFDLGLFAFATRGKIEADLHTPTLVDDRLKQHDERFDIGLNFKFSPDRQLWVKAGSGRQDNSVDGDYVSVTTAASLNRVFGATVFQPEGRLNTYRTDTDQSDWQVRFASAFDAAIVSFGVESAEADNPGTLDASFSPARLNFRQTSQSRSLDWHASVKLDLYDALTAYGGVWRQSNTINRRERATLDLAATPGVDFVLADQTTRQDHNEINPRVGLVWGDKPLSLRAVAQRWRRPASVGSLGDVDTLGIQLNDRLTKAGGLYSRVRFQVESESSERTFFRLFVDNERFDNGLNGLPSIVPVLELDQLEALKNRRLIFAPNSDIEETPEFHRGTLRSTGASGNFLWSDQHSLGFMYLYREGRQTGEQRGLMIPFIPEHMLRIGSQWSGGERTLWGVSATYRTLRYRDAANLEPLTTGWNFGANFYWESANKRNGVQLIVDNIVRDSDSALHGKPDFSFRYTYRF